MPDKHLDQQNVDGTTEKKKNSDFVVGIIGLVIILCFVAVIATTIISSFFKPKPTQVSCWYCNGTGYNCDIPNPSVTEYVLNKYPCKYCNGTGYIIQ